MTVARECVIGCGAMGATIALGLVRAGRKPLCIVRRRDHAKLLEEEGLHLTLPGGARLHLQVRALSADSIPGGASLCETAIVAVKAYSLAEALQAARRAGALKAWILVNGLAGPREALKAGYRERYIVSTIGATRRGDDLVEVRGWGELLLGAPWGLDSDSCRLAAALRRGGLRAWCTGRILYYRWLKEAVNAAINPLTSILWARNRVVVENEWAFQAARLVALEVSRVARALGIPLDPGVAVLEVSRVARETGDNVSSMLQDLEACRVTEAESILGRLVEVARELSVEARYVELLYILVKALEAGGLRCRRGRR